jgi:hypothetical protein
MLIECSHGTLAGPMEISKAFAGMPDSLTAWAQEA